MQWRDRVVTATPEALNATGEDGRMLGVVGLLKPRCMSSWTY